MTGYIVTQDEKPVLFHGDFTVKEMPSDKPTRFPFMTLAILNGLPGLARAGHNIENAVIKPVE